MTQPTLWFDTAPEISDQAAHDILGFLYELITAFENKYYAQLNRYDQQREDHCQELRTQFLEKQQDLFAELHDLPDF
jgi:ABC-type Zn2+ transport system substrate-binding protein/surface adhesin